MENSTKKNQDPVWLRIRSLNTGRRGEQTELMTFCGLAQNTYNGWNTGALKSYKKYIDKIAAFYGVSTDWILTGESSGVLRAPRVTVEFDNVKVNSAIDKMQKEAPADVSRGQEDRDFHRIERARKNMTEKDREKMMKILIASFEDYFSDDYVDEDIDE